MQYTLSFQGQLHGKGTIKYEDDGTILEGNFFNGALNGKARLFDEQENLISVGLYQAGNQCYTSQVI